VNRIGLDFQSNAILLAQIDQAQNQPIQKLEIFSMQGLSIRRFGQEDEVIVSVLDNLFMVKRCSSLSGGPSAPLRRLEFELKHMLLDNTGEYVYETIENNWKNDKSVTALIRLGTFRKAVESQFPELSLLSQLHFGARSIALGRGFLSYAEQSTDRLYCLLDTTAPTAALAIVHCNQLLDIASLSTDHLRTGTTIGLQYFAAELKTVIDFRRQLLPSALEKAPLIVLLTAGENILTVLRERLHTEVDIPSINETMIPRSFFPAGTTPASFLIALGLTID
jgi:hypothetical protein